MSEENRRLTEKGKADVLKLFGKTDVSHVSKNEAFVQCALLSDKIDMLVTELYCVDPSHVIFLQMAKSVKEGTGQSKADALLALDALRNVKKAREGAEDKSE